MNDPGTSELSGIIYEELRRIAAHRISLQSAGHTLQATALVHEAYLKLHDQPQLNGIDRGHFFRLAGEAMRQVLIDHARNKSRKKRGGGVRRAIANVAQLAAEEDSDQILALEEAIQRFEGLYPRAAEIVTLRFFAGLSVEETAAATGLSVRTVNREWKFARAWLFNALE